MIEQQSHQRATSTIGLGVVKRRVCFTMVLLPGKGWKRVGTAYGSKASAQGWVGFVSTAWHGLRVKVAQCTLRWKDGVMDERSRRILSEKFNMDPPADASAPAKQEAAPLPQTDPQLPSGNLAVPTN